jgi:hypothetical protein
VSNPKRNPAKAAMIENFKILACILIVVLVVRKSIKNILLFETLF